MKRRNFIQQTSAATAFIGIGGLSSLSFKSSYKKHITILHTNDVHSHIEPFGPDDSRNPNMGGVARRATLIQQIKNENPNTLLLDAGDIFQGTPYFNFYGGELEFKLMSKMKYDAATIGNHDFDNGIDGLYAQLPHAEFDFISSNYDFSNTVMDGQTHDHKIFTKDGVKIGIFGLGIELQGLVNDSLYKETKYLNPIEIAQDQSRILKEEKNCDLVICLSHLGYKYSSDKISDIKLAQTTKNIDLIIGGHTHTFLEKPTVETNKAGKKVLVNQVGCYGLYLGRIDFYLDDKNNIETNGVKIEV
ncbi:metallophosphatase [Salegentibacter salarius]|uniref:Metallophosphatase n=1 Tax=Salegentibacter salarius TaxID=435906 RepID=A0A2N0TXS2_9FLAO|nr:metallophosphatase [Salegentibacter salarius]OEY73197.1 metallophosphatase [Salegentibacter salarius]PKD19529.1 metallophosphatase [Salegentibacter salarius]SLJ98767.1 5'-nucleotidase [Salegentibacter salarius]